MNKSYIRVLKLAVTSIFFTLFFTSCTDTIKNVSKSSPFYHKNLSSSNDFNSLVNELVDRQSAKINANIKLDDVVLVSDFVNIDKLKNRSKLGFLLSEHLKNALASRNITVRAVELGREFQYGNSGFNLLTRKQADINKKYVDTQLAVVGTYSITTQSLIVFVKVIDISTGNILSSASSSTIVDEEILELERDPRRPFIQAPLVL